MKTRLFLILGTLVGCAGSVVACGEEAPPPSTVAIELDEYTVSATSYKAAAGHVTFNVRNVGSLEHELMVLRTDMPADRLLYADGAVVLERAGRLAGQVTPDVHGGETGDMPGDESMRGEETGGMEDMEHGGHFIGPDGTGQGVFDLEPGSYVLICNIPTHYRLGMYAELEVS